MLACVIWEPLHPWHSGCPWRHFPIGSNPVCVSDHNLQPLAKLTTKTAKIKRQIKIPTIGSIMNGSPQLFESPRSRCPLYSLCPHPLNSAECSSLLLVGFLHFTAWHLQSVFTNISPRYKNISAQKWHLPTSQCASPAVLHDVNLLTISNSLFFHR